MLEDWEKLFNKVNKSEYGSRLSDFLDAEYSKFQVYPPRNLMFTAFYFTNPKELKVVIIGQDPYHEPYQAMGMCFSVPDNIEPPPSLKNIYKEIELEYNTVLTQSGNLIYLARQGCLLLNTILTVRAHEPLSHDIPEYKLLIEDVLNYIDTLNQPIVFMFWGNNAKQYKKYIKNPNRLILEAAHPSPLSANRGGWFGCGHFKKANEYLKNNNIREIDWINR